MPHVLQRATTPSQVRLMQDSFMQQFHHLRFIWTTALLTLIVAAPNAFGLDKRLTNSAPAGLNRPPSPAPTLSLAPPNSAAAGIDTSSTAKALSGKLRGFLPYTAIPNSAAPAAAQLQNERQQKAI